MSKNRYIGVTKIYVMPDDDDGMRLYLLHKPGHHEMADIGGFHPINNAIGYITTINKGVELEQSKKVKSEWTKKFQHTHQEAEEGRNYWERKRRNPDTGVHRISNYFKTVFPFLEAFQD